jgi:hypothetical protein
MLTGATDKMKESKVCNKKQETLVIIPYNRLECILGDHLIRYNGLIWTTEEDLKLFPNTLTLKNPTPTEEFNRLMTDFFKALEV